MIDDTRTNVEIPFIEDWMRPGYCAGYATRAVEKLFGLKYNKADAWDLRYKNDVLWPKDSNGDYSEYLKLGCLIGMFFPRSSYLDEHDSKDHERKYTHIAVFVGFDHEGHPMILHNFRGDVRQELLSDFFRRRILYGYGTNLSLSNRIEILS